MINNKLSVVFPGQGSQSVGMLADIAEQYKEVQETFAEASEVLSYDLWALVKNGPAEQLDQTTHTQPALLTASYAIWRILQKQHVLKPAALAGHSLGEYTALVCAESLAFKDAVKLVAARGQYMQAAVAGGVGAMGAVVGLPNDEVSEICKAVMQANEVLTPANFNSVGQVVIAGHKTAVVRALELAKEKGAKLAVLIPVSVPSHCKLMQPAAEQLAATLNTVAIKQPVLTVFNNVDVKAYSPVEAIRDGLIRQLFMPVRWVEIIEKFSQSGITRVIECGPGKVLTGLNKRIDKNLELMTTCDLPNLQNVIERGFNP